MRDNKVKRYAAFGARLCAERAKQKELHPKEKERYQNRYIAKILGYSDVYLTKFFTGERLLSDDSYKKLADYWGVRAEYLRCEDDQRTETDLLSFMSKREKEDFDCALRFLSTAGIRCAPYLRFGVYYDDVKDIWDKLAPYLANSKELEDSINYIYSEDSPAPLSLTLDFKEGTTIFTDIFKQAQKDSETVNAIDYSNDELKALLQYIDKKNHIIPDPNKSYKDARLNIYKSFDSFNKKCNAEIRFNLYRKDKLLASCDSRQLFQFIDEIKSLSSCAFDALVARTEKAK